LTHSFACHVYYEDTDFAGVVYYANYFRYIERARTEWVRDLGVDQTRLKAETGLVFAVRRLEADYLAPARFDDDLVVETTAAALTGARLILRQDVRRGDSDLFRARVTLVALNAAGQAARLPAAIRLHTVVTGP
jgi:acyl-CoA thioester hydrolase